MAEMDDVFTGEGGDYIYSHLGGIEDIKDIIFDIENALSR